MMMLMQAMRGGRDPMQILQQLAANNPQARAAMQAVAGKSPQELQQIATNMARERGTTPEAIRQQLQQQFGMF